MGVKWLWPIIQDIIFACLSINILYKYKLTALRKLSIVYQISQKSVGKMWMWMNSSFFFSREWLIVRKWMGDMIVWKWYFLNRKSHIYIYICIYIHKIGIRSDPLTMVVTFKDQFSWEWGLTVYCIKGKMPFLWECLGTAYMHSDQ